MHIKIQEFVCEYCDKQFTLKQNRDVHQRGHKVSSVIDNSRLNVSNLNDFLLSEHYRERIVVPQQVNIPHPIPMLPSVSLERQEIQSDQKIPLLAILI